MKKRLKLHNYIFYIILSSFICSVIFIYYFNRKIGPGLIECAYEEVERLTVIVINNGVSKYLGSESIDSLLQISRNSKREIESISYNTNLLNKITNDIISILQLDILNMTKGNFKALDLDPMLIPNNTLEKLNDGILFSISMGSFTGNSFLANIGPKIPLNLILIGQVEASVENNIKEYGMNNALIELYVNVDVTTVIQMPFLSKKVKINHKVPLTIEIIQGNIPSYYLNSD